MSVDNGGKTVYQPYNYDQAIRDRLGHIDSIGESQNNYVQQVAQRRMAQQQYEQQAAMNNANQDSAGVGVQNRDAVYRYGQSPGVVSTMPFKQGKGNNVVNFLSAISGQESGGNYGARNASSGAMGKYQIMPGNIAGSGGWDREALGYNISTQQFMNSPALQEKIAQYKLTQYYNAYGPAGAAVAWYAGPGAVRSYMRGGGNGSEGNYPTIRGYANSILRKMGLA